MSGLGVNAFFPYYWHVSEESWKTLVQTALDTPGTSYYVYITKDYKSDI